jgi:pyridoxal biosynthesis lyase PdxS
MLSRYEPVLRDLLAQWLTPLQARIAEEAGAVAVMALERVPADIRVEGGVARMSDPKMIKEIMAAVTIPVMAKARIGHFVECQVRSLNLLATMS